MPVAGGWPAQLTTDRGGTPYWWDSAPQWSPDGRWLACAIDGHVQIIPADGGLPRALTNFTAGVRGERESDGEQEHE